MARPKKRGAAAGDREETTSLPTGRQPQHEDTVDEGIAATPDDTTLEAQVENEDSTYDSSPQKQTTPLQTPVRQNAATSTRSNRVFVDHSSSSFEAGHPSEAGGAPASVTQSKVVVLTVSPQKLRPLLESFAAPEKKVLLRVSPEKLRKLLQELLARDIVQGPAGQAEEPAEHRPAEMAPVKDQNPHDILDDHFKDVIQNFYDIGSITHGYLPESHGPLIKKSIDLTHSLAALSDLTADSSTHPAAPTIRNILIPPEVIDYVANGRNPDIYTREFVENVQRGNQVLNGKMQAFGSFAEMYARETKSAMPEMSDDMDRLMEHSGGFEQENGTGDWKMKKPQANAS